MQSPSTRRRKLRESPLLEPLALRSPPRSHRETSSPKRKPIATPTLSHETCRQWMLEALAALDATTLSLGLQHELVDSPQHLRTVDASLIESPSLDSLESRAKDLLTRYETPLSTSSSPAPKRPPVCEPMHTLLPLYTRGNRKSTTAKAPHCLPSKSSGRFAISPLISNEMRDKLQTYVADKIHGNHWQNEVRSRLARPLSATVFSTRDEQLRHPLTAAQFRPNGQLMSLYPYSIEAHAYTQRIGRVYRRHCFRQELLFHVRRLAIAIRYFRRVLKPWWIRAHRRRRCAAIQIQRQLRRFLYWKLHIVRPFAIRFVAQLTRTGCVRVQARSIVAAKLHRLVQERRAKEQHARLRRRVVYRWVAKTRVALFVHKIWCVQWFRGKRERNLVRLRTETAQLDTSDAAVAAEYATVFTTPFGRSLLKKELAVWRASIQKPKAISSVTSGDESESESVSDAVLRLRQCFAVFDMDGSGALDLDEFELMVAHLRTTIKTPGDSKRAKLTTAQLRDLFESLDHDGDATVTCSEFERWWTEQTRHSVDDKRVNVASGSASVSLLTIGLDRLVLTGHGMLFWLLGKKQQLERKFVKKRLVKHAQELAKRALLENWRTEEDEARVRASDETRRCLQCGRRYGLQRDVDDHVTHQCRAGPHEWNVDPFVWKKWIREEELRLLEEEEEEDEDEEEEEENESGVDG